MITRGKILRALLFCLLIVSIVARNGDDKCYFIGDAFAWCIALAIIMMQTRRSSYIIAEGIFLLTISNLLDELFFDPTKTQWNEWAFFVGVAILTTVKLIRYARRNPSA